jgi:hypothetical protein
MSPDNRVMADFVRVPRRVYNDPLLCFCSDSVLLVKPRPSDTHISQH